MPGRVYLSRAPLWENNLGLLNQDRFARVGGAKIYGVNTVLCGELWKLRRIVHTFTQTLIIMIISYRVPVPVFTPIGTMIVALYSTENLPRDVTWEMRCMQKFRALRPGTHDDFYCQ